MFVKAFYLDRYARNWNLCPWKGYPREVSLLKDYAYGFTGLGYFGDYKIEMQEGALVPKQDAPRTVSVALIDA